MRQDAPARPTPNDDVTASEIAAFAYCAKAWHLERVAGAQANDAAAAKRESGILEHERHGVQVAAGSWLGRHVWLIVGLLMLAAIGFGAFALLVG